MCARKKYNLEGHRNVHPENDKLIIDIFDSCNSVLSVKNLNKNLYPRSIKIVNDCARICEAVFLDKKNFYLSEDKLSNKNVVNA